MQKKNDSDGIKDIARLKQELHKELNEKKSTSQQVEDIVKIFINFHKAYQDSIKTDIYFDPAQMKYIKK